MAISKIITEKLFRVRENKKKIDFIIRNSGITHDTIIKAATLATMNDYHNFGHEIGSSAEAIKIAIAEGRPINEVTLVGLVMLFHDSGHQGVVRLYDEMIAVELANVVLLPSDTRMVSSDHNQVMYKMRDFILGTIFPNARGKSSDPLIRIIQDADLGHLGNGPMYWVWASMGLIEEFNKSRTVPLTPETFIWDEQEKFIKFLTTLSGTGKVYLSEGAQKIYQDPLETVQIIKNWNKEAIDFAYSVRKKDITLKEFEIKVSRILNSK